MNGDFDVVDDWGNVVGKFIPSGGGNGLSVILTWVILFLLGFWVYVLAKIFSHIVGLVVPPEQKKRTIVLFMLALLFFCSLLCWLMIGLVYLETALIN